MKLAIVHDFLNQYGGAERCVEAFHEIFPEAPIYTSIYLPENLPDSFKSMDIRVSFMQKFPFLKKHFKKYLMFYPGAIESFDLKEYDVILSSSSAFAKGITKGARTCHICYCYTPPRFIWNFKGYVEKEKFGALGSLLMPPILRILKKWDLAANNGVDNFVAISKAVEKRITNIYSRDSDVIYPPVNTAVFNVSDRSEDYFLVASRLNAYKRIDLVIDAFNKLNLPLRVIGDGPCRKKLQEQANKNITFMGRVDESTLKENYSHCRANIFPGEEDFGIVPLEAQASGRPVIALAAGGALETVIDGTTGIFFNTQTADSLIDAVNRFIAMEISFDSAVIRKNALKFDKEVFKSAIQMYVSRKYRNMTA